MIAAKLGVSIAHAYRTSSVSIADDPFPGVKSLRDPNVTLEQVRVAMETEDALAKSFNVPVTMLDLLAPLD